MLGAVNGDVSEASMDAVRAIGLSSASGDGEGVGSGVRS